MNQKLPPMSDERRCACGYEAKHHGHPAGGMYGLYHAFTPVERRSGTERREPQTAAELFMAVDMNGGPRRKHGSDRRRPVPEPSDIERENARHRAWAEAAMEEKAARPTEGSRGEGVGGSLVERLATRWKAFAETYPSAGEIPVEDDARFFLRAIADELGALALDESVYNRTGIRVAASHLRTEAER